MKFPDVGCDENNRPRPWHVKCNGQVFAGFDTQEAAVSAAEMWQKQDRPKHKGEFTFTVERSA